MVLAISRFTLGIPKTWWSLFAAAFRQGHASQDGWGAVNTGHGVRWMCLESAWLGLDMLVGKRENMYTLYTYFVLCVVFPWGGFFILNVPLRVQGLRWNLMIPSWESLVYCNSVIFRFRPGLLIKYLGKPVENQRNHKIWCLVQISDSRINNFFHRRQLYSWSWNDSCNSFSFKFKGNIDQTFPDI